MVKMRSEYANSDVQLSTFMDPLKRPDFILLAEGYLKDSHMQNYAVHARWLTRAKNKSEMAS